MRRQTTGWSVILLVALIMGVLAWRQGGQDEKREETGDDAMRREIRETVRRLKEAGFTPGVDATLRVF